MKKIQRALSLALCGAMLLGNFPAVSFALETDGLCEHHSEHIDCSYAENADCDFVCIMCSQQEAAAELQVLIDALPAYITQENLQEVGQQLSDIDAVRLTLTDEVLALVDFTAYQDAVAAIHALNGMPGAESPEEAAYSGSCGVGVSWVLENTGVMTISGSGRMNDYSVGTQVPWADYGFHTLIVEAGVTGIGSYAFWNNKYLTTVNLASGVSIGSGAFAGCTDLQEIDLSMVSSIGYGAFDGCTSLSTVTISESISSISQNAFRNCSSLQQVVLPNGLTKIENHAFEGCSSLTSITMPEGIQYIYSNAFEGCSGLRSVSIPASLISSPGTDAFRDCVNIDEVFITDLASWCALDFSHYSTEQSNPMYYGAALYLNGRKVENLEIPEGVSLEKGAYNFTGCSSIKSVTIPASYEGGINWIFRNCKSIEQIRFLGTAPKFIASDAFQGITATVYYHGGDSGWTAENRLNYGGNLTWVQDGEITACQCTYSVQGTCTKCGNYQPAEQNADGFYEIANPGQLFWFVKMVNDDGSADAVLTDNITIPEDWQWVGISSYSSTFDGNGKYISGIHSTSGGMFGTLQNEAVVQNLTVKDCAFINSSGNAGAIANTVSKGLVSDCHIISCTVSGSYAGGITGYTSGGENIEIENCSISGTTTITATDSSSARAGGIVGYVYNGSLSVSGCTVEAAGISGMYTGGILGYLENAAGPYENRYTTVTKCAVNATVSGSSAAGGIAGYISVYGNLNVDNCYAKGVVTSSAGAAGGILGEADDYLYNRTNAVISSCYSLAALTGTTFDHVYGSGSHVVKKDNCYGNISGKDGYMTPEQFASGEVTYLLNEGITDGSQHWYQTIGTGTPAFTGETVYQGYVDCENQMYSNQPVGTEPNHSLIEVVDDQYLKSEASCMSAAVYYKVCETCGTVSNTETFTFGESLPHSFNSATGMCEVCGQDIAVAKVTLGEETIFYQTFADAVAAAEEGTTENSATLTLRKDIPLNAQQEISRGTFVLDLNDCNLSGSNNNTVLHISGSANVTIQDGSIGGNGTISAVRTYEESAFIRDGVITMSGGALTIAGGSVSASGKYARGIHITAGTLTVSGGTVSGERYGIYLNGYSAGVTITGNAAVSGGIGTGIGYGVHVSNGRFAMDDGTVFGTRYGLDLDSPAEATISGGTITASGNSNASYGGAYPGGISLSGGTLRVTGGEIEGTYTGAYLVSGNLLLSGGSVSGVSYGMYLEGTDVNVTISDEGETSGYNGVMIRLGCLTMEDGGSVIGTNYGVSLSGVTTNNRGGSATINGGTIESGSTGLGVIKGSATINGGVIAGNSSGIYVGAQTATVTIHGGTVSGSSQDGIFAYQGTTNIIGGSVFGGTCDLFKGEKAIVTLGVSEDKEEGASFPGGITVSGTTLMDILDHEVSYWIGDEKQVLTTGQTTILADSNHPVTIKSECKHTNGSYTDNGDSHSFVCDACGNTVTELHSFTRELVDAKYLEHPATSTEAAIFCKSCVCGAASDAHTFVYGTVKNRLIVDSAELDAQTSVWVDGREFLIQQDGNARYVDLPDGNAKTMTVYTYGTSGEKQHPIGMKVWTLSNIYGFYTASRAEALDDMLQYEGCSIRIDGVQGIRMITSVEQADKKALTEDGLAGYTLKEYGTAIAWANKLSETKPLVLGKSYVNHNYAYKKGVADPIYDNSNGRIHYTNVIVGFTMKQCTKDIAMRPYMILEDAAGNEITLYGGIVERSIRYIASEILDLNIYKPDSAEYEYLQTILAGSSATN